MSGAEAGLVFGLISSVISIIEATINTYDIVKNENGQPEAFRRIAARLPLVRNILRTAEATTTLDEARKTLEPILKDCTSKATALQKIFEDCIRNGDDKWRDRCKKVLDTLRNEDRVEFLMEGILKDIQLLADAKVMENATDAQMKEIQEAIKEMAKLLSSLQEERESIIQNHNGSGHNIGNTGGTQYNQIGSGDIYHNIISGNASFGVNLINSTYYITMFADKSSQKCLKDLRTTDPREDKKRIEETSGPLLEDLYCWILQHSTFQRWRDHKQSRLLWIKGDPGKGKTMLLCGIINKMSLLMKPRDGNVTTLLSYFFCQAPDLRINNATAILRGLIYLLVDYQPSLISHVRKKYDQGAEQPFEGVNAWTALSMVAESILQDPSLENIYLIIDALDECVVDLPKLLNFIAQNSSSSRVKWIVSSRNQYPDKDFNIEMQEKRLCLELNEESVSVAVDKYIDTKLLTLEWLQNNTPLREQVRDKIRQKANATFRWVTLVSADLQFEDAASVLCMLEDTPAKLNMMQLRSEVKKLLKEAEEEFHRFTKEKSKDYMLLDNAVKKCKEALEMASKQVKPPYRIGILRANIHLAEFYREKSYCKCSPEGKMEYVRCAEKYVNDASALARETRNKTRIEQVTLEKALLRARRPLLEVRGPNLADHKGLIAKLSDAQEELWNIKEEYEKGSEIELCIQWWLKKLEKALEGY
ncbi:hypothetical protein B7463_g7301, partial [Scytalidium lignicola]